MSAETFLLVPLGLQFFWGGTEIRKTKKFFGGILDLLDTDLHTKPNKATPLKKTKFNCTSFTQASNTVLVQFVLMSELRKAWSKRNEAGIVSTCQEISKLLESDDLNSSKLQSLIQNGLGSRRTSISEPKSTSKENPEKTHSKLKSTGLPAAKETSLHGLVKETYRHKQENHKDAQPQLIDSLTPLVESMTNNVGSIVYFYDAPYQVQVCGRVKETNPNDLDWSRVEECDIWQAKRMFKVDLSKKRINDSIF